MKIINLSEKAIRLFSKIGMEDPEVQSVIRQLTQLTKKFEKNRVCCNVVVVTASNAAQSSARNFANGIIEQFLINEGDTDLPTSFKVEHGETKTSTDHETFVEITCPLKVPGIVVSFLPIATVLSESIDPDFLYIMVPPRRVLTEQEAEQLWNFVLSIFYHSSKLVICQPSSEKEIQVMNLVLIAKCKQATGGFPENFVAERFYKNYDIGSPEEFVRLSELFEKSFREKESAKEFSEELRESRSKILEFIEHLLVSADVEKLRQEASSETIKVIEELTEEILASDEGRQLEEDIKKQAEHVLEEVARLYRNTCTQLEDWERWELQRILRDFEYERQKLNNRFGDRLQDELSISRRIKPLIEWLREQTGWRNIKSEHLESLQIEFEEGCRGAVLGVLNDYENEKRNLHTTLEPGILRSFQSVVYPFEECFNSSNDAQQREAGQNFFASPLLSAELPSTIQQVSSEYLLGTPLTLADEVTAVQASVADEVRTIQVSSERLLGTPLTLADEVTAVGTGIVGTYITGNVLSNIAGTVGLVFMGPPGAFFGYLMGWILGIVAGGCAGFVLRTSQVDRSVKEVEGILIEALNEIQAVATRGFRDLTLEFDNQMVNHRDELLKNIIKNWHNSAMERLETLRKEISIE